MGLHKKKYPKSLLVGIKGSRLTADLTDRLRRVAIAHMPTKKIAAELGSGTAVAAALLLH